MTGEGLGAQSVAPLSLPHQGRLCVGDSCILVSQPSPLGKGDRAAVDRVLSQTAYLRRFLFHLYHLLETIFFALFHTASTLSGSLRSPPSPRGEGFVRRYSFSTYACIRFDDAGIAASSYRSLPHWVSFAGETVFSFLHPSHAKTTVSYERSFLCVLLA